ncbi:TPA: DNA-directed RNA polymerase subunit beta [Streptococcus suis]
MGEVLHADATLIKVLKVLLKIILFLLLLVLFILIGVFIGYAVIGDGKYWEVLNRDTWQHIINFIQ